MEDTYRVLVTQLEAGSDQYDDLIDGLETDDYQTVETMVDGLDALANPVMDWYDAVVVSMDDAHDVDYDGTVLDDKHVVLEGVTPLRQPDHIDASYNTADRVDEVVRSLRRDEWQDRDGVGETLAALLDDQRPDEMTSEQIEDTLIAEYGAAGTGLASQISIED